MKHSYIILEKDGRTVIASLAIHGPAPEKLVKKNRTTNTKQDKP